MPDRLLVTNATLIEVREDASVRRDAWVLCEDGIVLDTGAGTAPRVASAERIDAGGAFVAPGFVSSHSHLFTSVARGLGADESLYGWADAMYAVTRTATAEDVYWASMHGALDNIANGVTTVFDFLDPRTPWSSMRDRSSAPLTQRPMAYLETQIDSHIDSGIRSVMAVQIEGKGAGGPGAWDDFADAVSYIRRGDRRFALDAAVYGAAQWANDEALAAMEVRAMREFDVINQAHLLETAEQLDAQYEKFGWYDRAGALGPDMVFGHFVHPSPAIVDACVRAGCAVSWQPVANGRLASGTADAVSLAGRGVRVGLGLDDQACSDLSDPWQSMRFALFQARATSRSTRLRPADVLRMQTLGAAEVIGVDDRVGSLEPGKYADFVVVDPRHPDLGPLHDPLSSYVLSASLRNLHSVYIGGRRAAADGRARSPLAAEASRQVHRRFAPHHAPAAVLEEQP